MGSFSKENGSVLPIFGQKRTKMTEKGAYVRK